MDITDKENKYKKQLPWYKHVTVEPTMFLYMLAFMLTSVIEQTFYVFQACRVDLGFPEDVCYNISDYPDVNRIVQVKVASFHQWNGIAGHVVPLLLAFFLGAYSDKRGRKAVLLAGLIGKLYFSIMITVNTMFYWPVNYVIYTALLPCALTGADLAIFAGCFAYIADVTSLQSRTLRVGILDVVYLSAMPSGVAIGNVLYSRVLNRSFTAMFAINSSLMVLATLYSWVNLDWQTRPEQKSLKQAGVKNPVTDFLDMNNVTATLATLTRRRSHRRRLLLWILFISMAFYIFQRDERSVMYLYTTVVFQWDQADFSHFRTYLSVLYVLAVLVAIPLFTRALRLRDTVIVMVGAAAHMCGHVTYAQARDERLLYVGATAAALGPVVAPLLRAMTSKVLPPAERGVAFAFLSVMENAVSMVTAVAYSQLYKATLDTSYNNAIFYLTIATQAIVFLSAVTMDILLKGQKLETLAEIDTIVERNEKCQDS